MPTTRLAVAVDGGGTKTTASVATMDADGGVRSWEATAGPSNPAACGLEKARQNIAIAVRSALQLSHTNKVDSGPLVAGLAGIEATNAHEDLSHWARSTFGFGEASFVTDVELLHFAGSRELPAIVLIGGTGSVAYGKNATGTAARTGGRGYLMGDEGSGFRIGQLGLIAAVRALDHAAPITQIVQLIGGELGSENADAWTEVIYSLPDPRHKIASFSRCVVEAAHRGDAVALQILGESGRQLAHLVSSVAKQLDLKSSAFDLIMAGSIILEIPTVRKALDEALESYHMPIEEKRVIQDPAIAAARKCLESS